MPLTNHGQPQCTVTIATCRCIHWLQQYCRIGFIASVASQCTNFITAKDVSIGAAKWLYGYALPLGFVLFCSLAVIESIRELATSWTYFLYLSLSSVILIDSFTGSPVNVLMLSIQAVRGLPRLRALGVVPGIISFSRQLNSLFPHGVTIVC